MGLRDMLRRGETPPLKIQDIEQLLTKRMGRDGSVVLRIDGVKYRLIPDAEYQRIIKATNAIEELVKVMSRGGQ